MASREGPTPTHLKGKPDRKNVNKISASTKRNETLTKKLLGLQDIVLAVNRQFIEASAVGDGGLPAWHGDVLHSKAVELEDAGWVVLQLFAVLESLVLIMGFWLGYYICRRAKINYLHIGHPDFHFIQFVQNVCLGKTESSVSI